MALVVGVDGSVSCLDAVRIAVQEGARFLSSVRLVHAFAWPPHGMPAGTSGTLEGRLRQEARRMLAGAEAMARQTNPVVPVQRRLVTGGAAAVLIEQAAKVEMVVLGDRGLGGFAGLPVGSIALQVATHSPVPVLIVKGNIAAEGPVMVHGDGGLARTEAAAEHVMAWARREARARRAPLHSENAVATLIRLSETAQLIVVGAGGSAGQQLLQHAHCPVLVVPC